MLLRAASDLISENLQTFFPSNTLRELRTELRPQIPRPPYGYGDNSDAVAFGNQLRTFFHYLAAQKQSEPKGVETIRKSLFFAAEHIIALTSCNTAEFRMRWFNHAQEVGITSGDLSETIAKTIGVLAFHPLVSGSRELVERTKANKRGSLNLDGHPFQLLTNEPLVYEVRRSLIHNRKVRNFGVFYSNSVGDGMDIYRECIRQNARFDFAPSPKELREAHNKNGLQDVF